MLLNMLFAHAFFAKQVLGRIKCFKALEKGTCNRIDNSMSIYSNCFRAANKKLVIKWDGSGDDGVSG